MVTLVALITLESLKTLLTSVAGLTLESLFALRSLLTLRTLRTLDSLDSLLSSLSIRAGYTLVTLVTLHALDALETLGTTDLSDVRPSVSTPDVEVTVRVGDVTLAHRSRRREVSECRDCSCDRHRLTVSSGVTLQPLGTLGTFRAFRTLWTFGSDQSLDTLDTLLAGITLLALFTRNTRCSILAWKSLLALLTSWSGVTRKSLLTSVSLRTLLSWSTVLPWKSLWSLLTRNTLFTSRAGFTLRTLLALDTGNTLLSLRANISSLAGGTLLTLRTSFPRRTNKRVQPLSQSPDEPLLDRHLVSALAGRTDGVLVRELAGESNIDNLREACALRELVEGDQFLHHDSQPSLCCFYYWMKYRPGLSGSSTRTIVPSPGAVQASPFRSGPGTPSMTSLVPSHSNTGVRPGSPLRASRLIPP